jgi:glycerol transport system ATP-binding protein
MELRLEGISKKVGAQPWLYDLDLHLRPGAVTVLLGATQAKKSSSRYSNGVLCNAGTRA